MHTAGRISVHDFSDFRNFLRATYQERKRKNGRYSLEAWAKRLGLKGNSGLVMILQGKRNPSTTLTEALIFDLHLPRREATYFRDLVTLEKCKSEKSSARFEILERLSRSHPSRIFRSISAEEFQAVSQWYYYAIRELVDLAGFREDPAWIQRRLRAYVPRREIAQALATLEKLCLIERDPSGRLRYTNQMTSTRDIPFEALKRFHEQMLGHAARSLRDVDVKEREVSGLTFTLARKNLPMAKELIRSFYEELTALGAQPHDSVYQLELALFPLTKIESSDT
jgi:uncharacterized protein (TIGR02147 family)